MYQIAHFTRYIILSYIASYVAKSYSYVLYIVESYITSRPTALPKYRYTMMYQYPSSYLLHIIQIHTDVPVGMQNNITRLTVNHT